MGWKSIIGITREEALKLIRERAETASDEELGDLVEAVGYGDNPDLKYHGYNFLIKLPWQEDKKYANEEEERAEFERLRTKYGEH